MKPEYIAHVKKLESGNWEVHTLEDHLRGVATIAEEIGEKFSSKEWTRLAGLWHDLGKYRPAFQKHIKKSSGYDQNASISSENDPNKQHASTGAMYAVEHLDESVFGRVLAYVIAGHHAGLPDYTGAKAKGRSLDEALQDVHFLQEIQNVSIPEDILDKANLVPPPVMDSFHDMHCWIRMVFSALVDADFLDTEKFMQPAKTDLRKTKYPSLHILLKRFSRYMDKLTATSKIGPVNELRSDVLKEARRKAAGKPGIYTMTVPTGGGKTLSSLAFALEHSCRFKKSRIIYAIPYTSIIDQTASIFKEVFSPYSNVVLEHHCNVEPVEKKQITSTRLATENWDAPIIVTTTVQLFESLFAAKTSQCRKLHNMIDSVIVLDETQLLPPNYLNPIRHIIQLLSKHYGVTFLLTTATPTPNKGYSDALGKQLLQNIETTEIINRPERYYQSLKRVEFIVPEDLHCPQSWSAIADEILAYPAVLAIVNKRDDARSLFNALDDINAYHLSGFMCPIHRRKVIQRIKIRLQRGEQVRVVSTQLVEAGVDFDFPVVFRAVSGLDSIIQAAGRCNREGNLKSKNGKKRLGQVRVFVPPSSQPPGLLHIAFQTTTSILKRSGRDIGDPELVLEYFEQLHSKIRNFDNHNILSLLQDDADAINIQFRSAAHVFQMIEEDQCFPLFIDYGADETERKRVAYLLKLLANEKNVDRWLIRELQPYSINLYNYQKLKAISDEIIKETDSGYFVISGGGVYDNKLGFQIQSDFESSGVF